MMSAAAVQSSTAFDAPPSYAIPPSSTSADYPPNEKISFVNSSQPEAQQSQVVRVSKTHGHHQGSDSLVKNLLTCHICCMGIDKFRSWRQKQAVRKVAAGGKDENDESGAAGTSEVKRAL